VLRHAGYQLLAESTAQRLVGDVLQAQSGGLSQPSEEPDGVVSCWRMCELN